MGEKEDEMGGGVGTFVLSRANAVIVAPHLGRQIELCRLNVVEVLLRRTAFLSYDEIIS